MLSIEGVCWSCVQDQRHLIRLQGCEDQRHPVERYNSGQHRHRSGYAYRCQAVDLPEGKQRECYHCVHCYRNPYPASGASHRRVVREVPNEAIFVDGVLIEKAATAGKYFDGNWVAKDNTVLPEDKSNILTLTSSQIEDDVFEIDTSKVVNEIKVELKMVTGSGSAVASDYNQIFTDQLGSKKTTPQTRSLDSDWAIEDTSAATDLPTSVMMSKVRLLLAAQSRPQWRLSGSLNLVLDEVDDYA